MKLSEEMLYEHARKAEELWLNSLPSDDKIPEHRFSNKFERKMRKLIRSQRRSPGLNQFLSASKRIAVIALAILTVSFSCLMCVEAYREKFIEVITEIFEELTQFSFSSSRTEKTELGEITLEYLPDGMLEVYRECNSKTHNQSIYFEDIESRRIGIDQDIMVDGKQSTMILDTEDADVSMIDFNGYEATLIVKGEHTILMWEDDVSVILVSGDFPPDEIIRVASGIHVSEK